MLEETRRDIQKPSRSRYMYMDNRYAKMRTTRNVSMEYPTYVPTKLLELLYIGSGWSQYWGSEWGGMLRAWVHW
jgi:hypothetical protein